MSLASVLEFVTALQRRHTYSVRDNHYLWFGFLWGLPVPIVVLALHLATLGLPLSAAARCVAEHPFHLVFLAHPFLFAIVFGALGTIAHDREGQIRSLVQRLETEARTDGLTGLLNYRAFYEHLRSEVERARRQKTHLACLILDVDFFKHVNDRWGHLAGDHVLRGLAERIRGTSRPYDLIARYGGEEIAVLLPGAGLDEARSQAERIRAAVQATPVLAGEHAPEQTVTVSIGVAVLPTNAQDGGRLVQAADAAMYLAKRAGRNRVVCSFEAATMVLDHPRRSAAV